MMSHSLGAGSPLCSRRRKKSLARLLVGVLWILLGSASSPDVRAQSRPIERRQQGASITLSFYDAVGAASPSSAEPMRFPQTFDSLEAELLYLRRSLGWERIQSRYLRTVGLFAGEIFRDGLWLGGRVLDWMLTLRTVSSRSVTLDFQMRDGDSLLLDITGLQVQTFETIALLSRWQPPSSSPTAPAPTSAEEQSRDGVSLVVTLTSVVVPSSQLRDRPEDIAYPCDEYGRAVSLMASDVFIPPIIVERVVPKFPSRRRLLSTILVEGVITPEGSVTNVRVVRTFDAEMNTYAMDAFRRYRIRPARLNGRPTYAVLREEIRFQAIP